ncbi:MAG TPA: UDP-N-acetylglucosamine 1-carboxyvinyltransferase [Mollicutes bacterium]|nr:UDP-N-acetylglucosamine 1-carboxyvinyltransferase [Mollicutes bacterium]
MQKLEIEGNHILNGTVKISGAKNSAVALIPASILSDDVVTISNVPNITDRDALNEILTYLGANVKIDNETMIIDSTNIENKEIPESISKKLRASYYFMGALLGKYKKVKMYFPGGCKIGVRPINLHLKGFEALGANITEKGNQYIIEADELIGNNIYLDIASVGATINIMLAAVKAKGTTIIENAAKEPEVVNVAIFLNNMGARIIGAGTSKIMIIGVDKLNGCYHEVIPDRIEAGTYMIAAAMIGKDVKIANVIPEHLEALSSKLKEIGTKVDIGDDYFVISKSDNMQGVNIRTFTYPGFPTDLQQPITALLCQCEGVSLVEETIFENRFQNVDYLNKMGANIKVNGKEAKVYGPTKLKGCEVVATDLRAGACLVLAALVAEGTTSIYNIEHILRGYEGLVDKLSNLGAKIKIV